MGNFNSKPRQSDNSNPPDTSNPLNPLSKELPSMPIRDMVDYIASYYILTMDFASLNKLLNKKYCDKMIILTADIISAHVTSADIDFLEKKIVDGKSVDHTVKKNVAFLNRDDIDKLDIPDPESKQRACVGIAKYYIKIAHVFASIVMTLNPIYSYKDALGNTVKVPYYKKSSIPKDVKPELSELGLCAEKIHSLQGDQDYSKSTDSDIKVHPKMCAMNIKMDGTVKTLVDEPGIPDLMHLFYDDKYDLATGKFTGMSKETEQAYQDSVKIFYTTFTGNKDVPENVKEFKDIKLKDYRGTSVCSKSERTFVSGPDDNSTRRELFIKYASHVRHMMNKANKNQENLVSIVNRLFEHILDPVTKKTTIRVSSLLNDELLQPIVKETRKLIIELYLTCEIDYVEGVKIYEAIVQSVIIDVAPKQINALEAVKEKLVKTEKETEQPKPSEDPNKNKPDPKQVNPAIPVTIPINNSKFSNIELVKIIEPDKPKNKNPIVKFLPPIVEDIAPLDAQDDASDRIKEAVPAPSQAPAPTIKQAAPAPTIKQAAPAPIIKQAAPAPTIKQAAPAPAREPNNYYKDPRDSQLSDHEKYLNEIQLTGLMDTQ